jgi:hypothetical protein
MGGNLGTIKTKNTASYSSVVDPDPYSFWSTRSGSRRAFMTHKNKDISTLEELDVLF